MPNDQLLRVFDYRDGRQVRTVIKDGEPWFVAKDVCEILDIGNPSMALSRLDEDEKGLSLIDTPGGPQKMAVVNEPGLYALILTSRKPEAKAFKRWITHEVIPSIRKTGAYISKQLTTPVSIEDLIIMQAQSVKELKAKVAAIEDKVNAAHHRIDNLDKLDIIGDPQQRLNAMVKKYAVQNGLSFRRAWHEFRQAFNTAFRTNLTLLMEHYKFKHGLKELTIPQYLAAVGRLDDGIRVADKMLNKNMAAGGEAE